MLAVSLNLLASCRSQALIIWLTWQWIVLFFYYLCKFWIFYIDCMELSILQRVCCLGYQCWKVETILAFISYYRTTFCFQCVREAVCSTAGLNCLQWMLRRFEILVKGIIKVDGYKENSLGHVHNIPTMQFRPGISKNCKSKFHMLQWLD